MDQTLVINLTAFTQHVGVVHNDQADAVQIVPKGRTYLREGMTVDKRWLGLNPNTVRIVLPQPTLKEAPVSKGVTK